MKPHFLTNNKVWLNLLLNFQKKKPFFFFLFLWIRLNFKNLEKENSRNYGNEYNINNLTRKVGNFIKPEKCCDNEKCKLITQLQKGKEKKKQPIIIQSSREAP